MKLITKEILKKLPNLYETEDIPVDEKKIPLKLFSIHPKLQARWYFVEYDPETRTGFAYVTGMYEDEFGYVSLDEIEELNKNRPFPIIERDLHWDSNTTIGQVKRGEVF